MRHLLAFVVAALMGCCCLDVCRPVPLESAVDAPVTLDDVKRQHAPPLRTVTVTRVTKPAGGGGACGHSPLCVIVLPIMAYEALFPDQHDEAVIVDEGGVETYRGMYTTGGDFLQARVVKDGTVRVLRQLKLERLRRRVVVEVARGPVGTDPQPVPIVPQIDLVTAYQDAINKESGDDRGLLLAEALTWLDEEAAALVLQHLGDKDEPDASKAAVADALCHASAAPAILPRALTALVVAPGEKTAVAMLRCGEGEGAKLSGEQLAPFSAVVVDKLCKSENASSSAFGTYAEKVTDKEPVRRQIKACANAPARAGMLTALGDVLGEQELAAALDTIWGPDIVKKLNVTDPVHRRLLAPALDTKMTASVAVEKASSAAAEGPLPAVVNEALARRVVRGFDDMFCRPHEDRASALMTLDVSRRTPGAELVSTKKYLLAARAGASKKEAPFVEAALVAIGAPEANVPLWLSGITASTVWHGHDWTVCDEDQVLAYLLSKRGCQPSDLEQVRSSGKIDCHH